MGPGIEDRSTVIRVPIFPRRCGIESGLRSIFAQDVSNIVSVIEAVAHEIGVGLEVHRVFGDIG